MNTALFTTPRKNGVSAFNIINKKTNIVEMNLGHYEG